MHLTRPNPSCLRFDARLPGPGAARRAGRRPTCDDVPRPAASSGIHAGLRERRKDVGSHPPDGHRWIVAPLVDAGLGQHDVRDLLFRLAFHAITDPPTANAADLVTLVDDRPPRVQAAWVETIDRLLRPRPG